MSNELKELALEFPGKGSMACYHFKQIYRSDKAYVYELSNVESKKPHYEVFLHKINRRFNQVSYPGGESFGYWAWCYTSLEDALEKFEEISA